MNARILPFLFFGVLIWMSLFIFQYHFISLEIGCGCPSTWEPVCGTDKEAFVRTYINNCTLNCHKYVFYLFLLMEKTCDGFFFLISYAIVNLLQSSIKGTDALPIKKGVFKDNHE